MRPVRDDAACEGGEALRERWRAVCARVRAACREAGRDPADVRLVAVSKFQPAAAIACVAAAGQADFGENYVQEARSKQAALAGAGLRWHMIGHVQSRKARDVAGRFVCIHTLDSLKLARALEAHLAASGMAQDVLIQVNVGEEAQKSGVTAGELPALAEAVLGQCPHLRLQGLMCLPPVFDAGMAARPHFARLREWNESLRVRLGLPLPELSMGMSGDFAAAIQEGATMVRIGTDIFGLRPPGGVASADMAR